MALLVQMHQSIELLKHVNEEDLPLKVFVDRRQGRVWLSTWLSCAVRRARSRRQAPGVDELFSMPQVFFFIVPGPRQLSLPLPSRQCDRNAATAVAIFIVYTHTHTNTKERKTRNKIKFLEATKKRD